MKLVIVLCLAICALMTTASPVAKESDASRESVVINGRTYDISINHAHIYLAREKCAELGMTLVSIETEEEQLALTGYLAANGHLDKTFWTSGYRNVLTNTFQWSSTGQDFTYTNWHTNQPDEMTGLPEVCVSLDMFNGIYTWWDDGCSRDFVYICEQI